MGTGRTRLASVSGKHSSSHSASTKKTRTTNNRSSANSRKRKNKNKSSRHTSFIVAGLLIIAVSVLFVIHQVNVKPPDTINTTSSPAPPKHTDTPSTKEPGKTGSSDDPDNPDNHGEADTPVVIHDEGSKRKEDFYTVLITGTNDGLADVLMVMSFDAVNDEVHVINIPRDTYVQAKRSLAKINGALNNGGVDLLLSEIESIVGFKPDRYAIFDYEAFVELVDVVGKVEVNVPFRMEHWDDYGVKDIDLYPGVQKLDGEQALGFVRFRNPATGEDLGRIKRTQELISILAKQTLKLTNITKLSKFVDIFTENVKTDMTWGEIFWFGEQALGFNAESNLHMETLPLDVGSYMGTSYVFLRKEESLDLINASINPYTTDISDVKIVTRQMLSK